MADKITITATDDQMGRIDELAERLRRAGMQVEQILGPIGMITGTATPAQRSAIKTFTGIAAIEDDTHFQLPDPGADTQ
jgi:hypothetical protein